MEKLNYHKLLNLKKRYDKYDCEISKEIVAVIDKHLILEKEKNKIKDRERRDDYQFETIACKFCGKEMRRANIYKHYKTIHPKSALENDSEQGPSTLN